MCTSDISDRVLGFAQEILDELGPSHSEKVYQNALLVLLREHGLKYAAEVVVPLEFHKCFVGFMRLDIVVDNTVIIELKAGQADIKQRDCDQTERYLRHTDFKEGLLVNFGYELTHKKIKIPV